METNQTVKPQFTHPRRTTPRAEYRRQQVERVNLSATLAEKFPRLKLLVVRLEYFDSNRLARNGQIKYKANLEHAKSLFCVNCPNGECVGGDFDLTDALAQAVKRRDKAVEGELRCQGQRHKAKAEKVPCQSLLRYRLTLGY